MPPVHKAAERPWQSRVPLLLAAPAAVALLFLVLPLVGLVIRAPWADAGAVLTSEGALQALRLSMITATVSVIIVVIYWRPTCLGAGPAGSAWSISAARPDHDPFGAAARRRWRRPVHRAGPFGTARSAAVPAHRFRVSLHPVCSDLGSGLRCAAVSRAVGGGCAARSRPPLRGGRFDSRGAASDGLSPHHVAAHQVRASQPEPSSPGLVLSVSSVRRSRSLVTFPAQRAPCHWRSISRWKPILDRHCCSRCCCSGSRLPYWSCFGIAG